jgi:thiazole synthase ThiGH ThiG subunit
VYDVGMSVADVTKRVLDERGAPLIVDAGVGTASDAAVAMELGADGVLLNTGIAHAKDPLRMAFAMKHACEAGRLALLEVGAQPDVAVGQRHHRLDLGEVLDRVRTSTTVDDSPSGDIRTTR